MREMQLSQTSSFHFPLMREMQQSGRGLHGILYFHFPLMREMQRARPHIRRDELLLSFPAYARDATMLSPPDTPRVVFHFPLMREMQLPSQASAYSFLIFHFPLMREMQQRLDGFRS